MELILNNVDETIALGNQLGSLCNKGDIICLVGDLGSGKTHMSKGIAKGLEIDDHVTSPTFTIVNEYQGRLKFYHFDVYRVNDPDEIDAIGFDEYIFGDGISVIEWANYIKDLIPNEALWITIEKNSIDNLEQRKISFTYTDKRYDYIKELQL